MDGTSHHRPIHPPLDDVDDLAADNPADSPNTSRPALPLWRRPIGQLGAVAAALKRDSIRRAAQGARVATGHVLKALSVARAGQSILLPHARRIAFLPPAEPAEPEAPDPVQIILADFERLDRAQQDLVAENLALLWHSFLDAFGGVSGFHKAAPTQQSAFIEKLAVASRRMETSRGTETTFYYTTVELMRQYVSFFQVGSTDHKAIVLARCVAALIDRGQQITERQKILQA